MGHDSADKGDGQPPNAPATPAHLGAGIVRRHEELDRVFGKPLRDLRRAFLGGGRDRVIDASLKLIAASHRQPTMIDTYTFSRSERSPNHRPPSSNISAGNQADHDSVSRKAADGGGPAASPTAGGSGADIATWNVETLSAFIDNRVLAKKGRTPRGETTCERLRKLMQEDPGFVVESSERQLARRIGRKSPGCFSGSAYWNNEVRKLRMLHRTKIRGARRGTKRNSAFMTIDQARSADYDQREYVAKLQAEIDRWESPGPTNPDTALDGGH